MFRDVYITKARKRLSAWVMHTREQIFPVNTQGMFNYQCFDNAVQYAIDRPDAGLEVVEVIYLSKHSLEVPVLHYVVRDGEGKYLEVTLGYQVSSHWYYLIRTVPRDEWQDISSMFDHALSVWVQQFTNPLLRNLFRIDRLT